MNQKGEISECDTYPTNIKLYHKLAVIGRGAFGCVRIIFSKYLGLGCKSKHWSAYE